MLRRGGLGGMIVVKILEVIHHLQSLGSRPENTVDALISGNDENEVTGIATTFMPTVAVLQRACQRHINLVIAHESPFYNHRPDAHAVDDPVYLNKMQILADAHMALFRLHDTLHRRDPDWIAQAVVHELDWDSYVTNSTIATTLPFQTHLLEIPEMSLKTLAGYVKQRLRVPFVRVVGDLNMSCRRIGLLPGYSGTGALVIPFFRQAKLDVVIVGEGPEWEAPEYVRDAVLQGSYLGLVVVGHLASEAAGMKLLAQHLQRVFSHLNTEYLDDSSPFVLF